MASIARKQRRMNYRDSGFLKVKNMYSRFSPQGIAWYAKMAEDGAAASDAYQKLVDDSIADQLQKAVGNLMNLLPFMNLIQFLIKLNLLRNYVLILD